MNNHAYKVLEFYKIKEVLAKYAITDEAIERILDLEPYSDTNKLKKELETSLHYFEFTKYEFCGTKPSYSKLKLFALFSSMLLLNSFSNFKYVISLFLFEQLTQITVVRIIKYVLKMYFIILCFLLF